MKSMLYAVWVLVAVLFSKTGIATDTIQVKSPDGKIGFMVWQQSQQLYFSVKLGTTEILKPSPFLFTVNGTCLTQNSRFLKHETYTHRAAYSLQGVHAKGMNYYNGLVLFLTTTNKAFQSDLDIRVFNDGVAFRHRVLGGQHDMTPDETTILNLPTHSMIWYHDLNMHYEGVHVKKQIDFVQAGEWVAPPATFKLPQGVYAAITEAALLHYPGMALLANGRNGLVLRLANTQPTSYPYKLRYSPDDTLRLKQPSVMKGPFVTPWRVVLIGKDLNALVNSDIIANLNPAPDPRLFPKGEQISWIKPGRAVWKYLNGGGDGTVEVMKHFTDGAAALGFEHNILEGFWSKWTDEQLQDLVTYSRQKGVGIWLWKHSRSLRTPESRDSFFKKCKALGIAGAKIDFFDHEAKETIDLYEALLNEAARYHVLLDFHGANKPTGLHRTYPNVLVYEGVKGMEASKLNDRATHETTIPFTRWLAGPAEYTVVHFGERRKNTTWAHQIASAAILSAPLLTYAAHPDSILLNPAVDIIKSIPATWDETIVLPPSEIGELAVYGRRKGNMWIVAVMNGTTPKKITVPLTFLKGTYKALIAKDHPADPASVVVEQTSYTATDRLELNLTTVGGYIAQFIKQ